MNRFLKGLFLSTTLLATLSTAQAGSPSRDQHGGREGDRHEMKKIGREYKEWKSCYFDERFHCFLYLHHEGREYYYWCKQDDCYYPVTFCPYGVYECGVGCVCSTCPVMPPSKPPIKWGGNPPRPVNPPKPPAPTKPEPILARLGNGAASIFKQAGLGSGTQPAPAPTPTPKPGPGSGSSTGTGSSGGTRQPQVVAGHHK